jgi:fructosamine-3-kinase
MTYQPDEAQLAAIAALWGLGPLVSVAPLGGGVVNSALLLNGRAVLRINTREPDAPKIAKEAWALGWVGVQGLGAVRVPAVLGVDTARTILPYDYLLLEYLPDPPADAAWEAAGPAERAGLSRQMGAALARLHALPLPGARWGGWDAATGTLGTAATWAEVVIQHQTWVTEQAADLGLLPPADLAAVRAWFARYAACVPADPPRALVHGDWGLWNAMAVRPAPAAPPAITAVFDFEWAQAAAAPLDFPPMFYDPGDPLDPAAFLAGYTSGARLPTGFVQQAHYYTLAYHLDLLGVAHKYWGGRHAELHRAAITALLDQRPIWGWAAAGYAWPFT